MFPYLLSSFPSISLDGESPLDLEGYLDRCREQLSAKDLHVLHEALDPKLPSSDPFVNSWRAALQSLQDFSTEQRLKKLPQDFVRGEERGEEQRHAETSPAGDDNLRQDAISLWEQPNPLVREQKLQALLWDWLAEQRKRKPMGLVDLLGLGLQLQLLERRRSWQHDAGQTNFTSRIDTLLGPMLSQLQEQESSE